MPEIIQLSREEIKLINKGVAPEAFRFAKADDFHTNGVRNDNVQIYLLMATSIEGEMVEFGFNHQTKRNWLQWQLNRGVVFIKTDKRDGFTKLFYPLLMPTDDYLNEVLKISGGC